MGKSEKGEQGSKRLVRGNAARRMRGVRDMHYLLMARDTAARYTFVFFFFAGRSRMGGSRQWSRKIDALSPNHCAARQANVLSVERRWFLFLCRFTGQGWPVASEQGRPDGGLRER